MLVYLRDFHSESTNDYQPRRSERSPKRIITSMCRKIAARLSPLDQSLIVSIASIRVDGCAACVLGTTKLAIHIQNV